MSYAIETTHARRDLLQQKDPSALPRIHCRLLEFSRHRQFLQLHCVLSASDLPLYPPSKGSLCHLICPNNKVTSTQANPHTAHPTYLTTVISWPNLSTNSSPPHLTWASSFDVNLPPCVFFWSIVLLLSSSWNQNGPEQWPSLKLMTMLPYHFAKEGARIKSELTVSIDAETAYNVYSSASEGTMMEATALFSMCVHFMSRVCLHSTWSVLLGFTSTRTKASISLEGISASGVHATRYWLCACGEYKVLVAIHCNRVGGILPFPQSTCNQGWNHWHYLKGGRTL